MQTSKWLPTLAILTLTIFQQVCAEPINTGTLVREMIDMKRMTDFPSPSYKTVQFSSHDHRSTHPGGPDWYANSDGFGREPIPNFEGVVAEPNANGIGTYLICDVEGPGAVVRVWTARIDGDIRMYLDGSTMPVFDGSAQDFFMRTYAPYIKPSGIKPDVFDFAFSQRQAGYYPIPFAKRCRIEWIGNVTRTHFYEVQIREYDSSAEVTTFTPGDLKTYRTDIEHVSAVMKEPDSSWGYYSIQKQLDFAANIPASQTIEAVTLNGPQAIERLTLHVHAADLDRALRQTILNIRFDGYPWGQVQSPIGDFFGAAPGINPYDSVPFTVHPDGRMTCRFVMPFKKSMRLSLENRGDQPVSVTGSILPLKYQWNDETSMHFRARWDIDHDLLNSSVYDLPFLLANGKGVYVGTASILMNPCNVPTSYGNWWGEGDEKIFIDDDVEPSTFGTGSEDYYNYAWSSADIFQFPYCGQPRNDGPDNRGFVTNHRWHILDPLPFQNRINFYMEFFSHERTPGYSYARIAYHYARPGTIDGHIPISNEDVRIQTLQPWQPEARGAARDAVFFQTEELAPAQGSIALDANPLYAGGTCWVWTPSRKKETVDIPIPVFTDDEYRICLTAELSGDSGIFSSTFDGKNIALGGEQGTINLHKPYRRVLRNFYSQTLEMKEGDHTLTLKYLGSNKDAGNRIGIDFIWVQKR